MCTHFLDYFYLMASTNEDKNAFFKFQPKRMTPTSKVKFDLDGSQHTDDADESLDEFMELSSLSKNPSLSSIDSVTNGTVLHTRLPSNHESKTTTKRYSR